MRPGEEGWSPSLQGGPENPTRIKPEQAKPSNTEGTSLPATARAPGTGREGRPSLGLAACSALAGLGGVPNRPSTEGTGDAGTESSVSWVPTASTGPGTQKVLRKSWLCVLPPPGPRVPVHPRKQGAGGLRRDLPLCPHVSAPLFASVWTPQPRQQATLPLAPAEASSHPPRWACSACPHGTHSCRRALSRSAGLRDSLRSQARRCPRAQESSSGHRGGTPSPPGCSGAGQREAGPKSRKNNI